MHSEICLSCWGFEQVNAAIVTERISFRLTKFNPAASSMESSIALCLHKRTRRQFAKKKISTNY